MNFTSELLITPKKKTENFGLHEYLNLLLDHCLHLGFKPVESIQNPNVKKFINLNFHIDSSSIYQHVPMLSPFELDPDGNMEVRNPFIWYTDLSRCQAADVECETFMVQLNSVGRSKFMLYKLGLAFCDKFEVAYTNSEFPDKKIVLDRNSIENFLNPLTVLDVA